MYKKLGGNYLPDTSCIQLASVIRNNRSLKTIVLSDNRLYGPHFGDFMETFSSPDCKIEELELAFNDLPDTACIQLASGIQNNRSLKILNLTNNRLFGPHFIHLTEAMCSPNCRIEKLLNTRLHAVPMLDMNKPTFCVLNSGCHVD
ncbi:ribonuclease inhibitor-like [Phyllobates terribilis]|uniref:ribonuclease inhibitor-like n=1 Tax=Phyllobates terribilis TaxID=111132 RepID=UPI003CCA8149